jgi:pimeloyl-ACP methyl ester carboxylesterase
VVGRITGAPGQCEQWQETPPFQVWAQTCREVLAAYEGLPVPATLLTPVAEQARAHAPWVIFVDEAGRRAALESWGPAARLGNMLDREPDQPHPHVLVPDLPGWGDSTPALAPYALAGWGSMDRLTAYLSCAVGDGILAQRVRCVAGLVQHLTTARGVPPARLVLIGRGLGGPVVLMAAALAPSPLGGVASWSALASFHSLAEAESYAWPAGAVLPDVLAHFDLPELVATLPGPVAVLEPLDAERRPLTAEAAQSLYGSLPSTARLVAGRADAQAAAAISWLLAQATASRNRCPD